jgi:hypothetical protein
VVTLSNHRQWIADSTSSIATDKGQISQKPADHIENLNNRNLSGRTTVLLQKGPVSSVVPILVHRFTADV